MFFQNNLYCLTAEGWYYVFDVKVDCQSSDAVEVSVIDLSHPVARHII